MNLLIENGQLLKPRSLPWQPTGWAIPKGWTPERTPEMEVQFDKSQAALPDAPPFVLWAQIQNDEGKRLQLARRPWLGWVMVPSPLSPVATKQDKRVSRAYRRLYSELNVEYSKFIDNKLKPPPGVKLTVPPDGRYVFRGGRMVAQ